MHKHIKILIHLHIMFIHVHMSAHPTPGRYLRLQEALSFPHTALRMLNQWNLTRHELHEALYRGHKDHINTQILHSGSKSQDKADSRNHGFLLYQSTAL